MYLRYSMAIQIAFLVYFGETYIAVANGDEPIGSYSPEVAQALKLFSAERAASDAKKDSLRVRIKATMRELQQAENENAALRESKFAIRLIMDANERASRRATFESQLQQQRLATAERMVRTEQTLNLSELQSQERFQDRIEQFGSRLKSQVSSDSNKNAEAEKGGDPDVSHKPDPASPSHKAKAVYGAEVGPLPPESCKPTLRRKKSIDSYLLSLSGLGDESCCGASRDCAELSPLCFAPGSQEDVCRWHDKALTGLSAFDFKNPQVMPIHKGGFLRSNHSAVRIGLGLMYGQCKDSPFVDKNIANWKSTGVPLITFGDEPSPSN